MNKKLIRDLAITGGIYDCICDPYDKLKNGDPYSSVMVDLERFAEKIVRECVGIVAKRKDQAIDDGWNVDEAMSMAEMDLEEHFGVKE